MKKSIFAFFAMAALAVMGCNKENIPSQNDTELFGEVTFVTKVDGIDGTVTKASTTELDKEKAMNDIQVLVFKADGTLVKYLGNSDSKTGVKLAKGSYTAFAVVNGPDASSVSTKSALEALTIGLADYNDPSSDFVMGAQSESFTVGDTKVTVAITVDRYVARVNLVSVTNGAAAALGAITINGVMLTNVVANQTVKGDATAATWYNEYGRPTASVATEAAIIDGSTYKADGPALTWNGTSSTVAVGATSTLGYKFYGYANSATGNDEWSATYAPSYSRLVVIATLNGTKSYYPVVLNKNLQRNYTYDITLTITGEGADDPQGEVEKGAVDFTITENPWTDGGDYDAEI